MRETRIDLHQLAMSARRGRLSNLDDEDELWGPSVTVRFQGPATGPAGAEDVTDLWGVGHGYGGHGFAGAVVACGAELRGLCSWVPALGLRG